MDNYLMIVSFQFILLCITIYYITQILYISIRNTTMSRIQGIHFAFLLTTIIFQIILIIVYLGYYIFTLFIKFS